MSAVPKRPQARAPERRPEPLVPFKISDKGVVSIDANAVARTEVFKRNLEVVKRLRLASTVK